MVTISPPTIVLASGSPRRQELLAAMGLRFTVRVADIDESLRPGESPEVLVARLSLAKAQGMARPGVSLVVAADTVVVADRRVLGKPQSPQEATDALLRLRSRRHEVFSGLAVLDAASDRQCVQVVCSPVWMRDYDPEEVRRYVASGDPLDKAGAYAIQHDGFAPVAHIDGCYANVMGLPMCHLYRVLGLWHEPSPVHPLQSCPLARRAPCPHAQDILQAPPDTWDCG